jgi:hypothetical protein
MITICTFPRNLCGWSQAEGMKNSRVVAKKAGRSLSWEKRPSEVSHGFARFVNAGSLNTSGHPSIWAGASRPTRSASPKPKRTQASRTRWDSSSEWPVFRCGPVEVEAPDSDRAFCVSAGDYAYALPFIRSKHSDTLRLRLWEVIPAHATEEWIPCCTVNAVLPSVFAICG